MHITQNLDLQVGCPQLFMPAGNDGDEVKVRIVPDGWEMMSQNDDDDENQNCLNQASPSQSWERRKQNSSLN